MIIKIKRTTGFFGMGSPLQVLVNNEVITNISEKQTKEINIQNSPFTIQIKFFLLKSPLYTFSSEEKELAFEIIMNPRLIQIYVALFLVSLFIPVMLKSIAVSVLLVLLYFLFIIRQLKKAYLLVEVP